MPLTQTVTFKTLLQSGNRLQVPKLVRWQFKMDSNQTLKIGLHCPNAYTVTNQSFYSKMSKDGRIFIPRLILAFFQTKEKRDLRHYVFEVTLEPV